MADSKPLGPWRRFTTRQAEKRAALVAQTWPEFFRTLGIEIAVIAAIIIVALIVVLVLRPH